MAIDLSAWTGEFHDRPWVEVAERCRVMSDRYPEFQHMTDIVDSILRSGCDQQLAGQTSMHDLIVTTRPISEPPIEEVVVRAPSSLVPVADGTVVIDCLSDRGHANRIAAPVDEAVSLFWRCIATSFDVRPTWPTG
ncbi:hypothetical protein [Nocardia otitidiscaviarum]|uniref:hypothetical protein n=1 Tax=Nocardia otitidiscaviarum TaxID=1823 RepID=UPI0018944E8F|nr:hypothetical protein [Nocardia otitidiscaviarum]MBF6182468.1 hypothetical protein [Nocardia otitidiscaviarum]